MILANHSALIQPSGVLNATALAIILRVTETLFVRIRRVLEEGYGRTQNHGEKSEDGYEHTPRSFIHTQSQN